MKKLLCVIISVIMAMSMLTGCAGGEVEQTNTGLTVSYIEGSELTTRAIEIFREQYPDIPIEADVTFRDSSGSLVPYLSSKQTELMSGKGADIVMFPNAYGTEKMLYSGSLADMSSFFEKDEEFNPQDYPQAVFDACRYNGAQYIIPLSYDMSFICTSQKALDIAGINQDNCSDYFGLFTELDKAKQKLNIENKKDIFFFDYADVASKSFPQSGLEMWNVEKQTANINTSEFKKVMELSKSIYTMGDYPFADDMNSGGSLELTVKALQSGNPVFFYIPAKNAFRLLRAIPSENEAKLMAIRDINGGISVRLRDFTVVKENSPNLENAYKFIKILLSPELQQKGQLMGFPVNKVAVINELDMHLSNMAGEDVHSSADWVYTEAGAEMTALSQENYDAALGMIDAITSCYHGGGGAEIILENMQPYFDDEKSYEECIKKAQEQLEIYVSE